MKKIADLINAHWKFDNNQVPVSSWHSKQDLIEKLNTMEKNKEIFVLTKDQLEEVWKGARAKLENEDAEGRRATYQLKQKYKSLSDYLN